MVITDKLFKQGKIITLLVTERLPKTHALTILRQASVLLGTLTQKTGCSLIDHTLNFI